MKAVVISIGFALATLSAGTVHAGPGSSGHGHGHESAYGEPGDPKKPARVVVVTMKEADGKMLFSPNKLIVSKGEQIRFKLQNEGLLDHEIVLATLEENLKHAEEMKKNPEMEHDDPNAKRVAPAQKGEIVWKFTKEGTFDFSCLIPGHRESGMFGTVIVK
jgi:uncharacterized cupredoxin-like copper-binding protein